MTLINIIRASRGEPLSFIQLGTVAGTTTTAATLGLPPLVLGPQVAAAGGVAHTLQSDVIFGANAGGGNGFIGNAASISGQTQFQVTPIETKEFYLGLLRPVDPRILQLFVGQGIARESLFYLFTDRVILDAGGRAREIRNDPLDPGFSEFQHIVALALDYGISSEPVRGTRKGSAARGSDKTGSDRWRLCFNEIYRSPEARDAGNAPICGSPDGANAAEDRTVTYRDRTGRTVKLTVIPRSAFGIFQYLGRIIGGEGQRAIKLRSQEAIDYVPFRDDDLFRVEHKFAADCYLTLTYDSETWCVPNNAINSKKVLGILTQLIALNTAITDVPVTPTVRILQ